MLREEAHKALDALLDDIPPDTEILFIAVIPDNEDLGAEELTKLQDEFTPHLAEVHA